MGLLHMSIRLHIYIMMIISLRCICNAFNPIDNYLIDCGSSTNTTIDTRIFQPDLSISSAISTPKTIFASTKSSSISSFDSSTLYQTARIFDGPSSYSFPIRKQGRHFVRLYFFPFLYQSYNLTDTRFVVSTQDFILLSNFNARSNSGPLLKEYSLNITSDELILAFTPLEGSSIAFVNAIEVISAPDDLIAGSAQILNPSGIYKNLQQEAMETVYRVNMGGPKVSPSQDALGRTWVSDKSFILDENLANSFKFSGRINYPKNGGATEETAPNIVYATARELASSNTANARFNATWEFDVDASSSYFIRLHFCDIVSKVLNALYFNVYINGMSALHDFDLSALTLHTLAAPHYVDFVVEVSDESSKLRISIGPSKSSNVFPNAILNGLEVMKMNVSSGNFDGSSLSRKGSRSNLGVVLGSILCAAVMVILAIVLVIVLCRQSGFLKRDTIDSSLLNSNSGLRFSFIVLQEATQNFDENRVIGVGGFGKVYKGVLRDGTIVAVKRGNPKSQQGLKEFRTEIDLLSRLRHRHLVSLIGYCEEHNEMILVYEYMEKGTLKSHLYGSDHPNLSWNQRLEICIGSAKGLHYLHAGSSKAVIHRDVKSANILLDENLVAKVADFGLSKTGPEMDQTHVSTMVKGSFGYLDPEYFRRQQLTEKSDVYSFGVLLIEVLCARPVLDPSLPREMVNLAEWAMKFIKRGEVENIADPRIVGSIESDSLKKFVETVEKCLAECGVDRPTMGDVLWNLEYALQIQEASPRALEDGSMNRIQYVGENDGVDLEEGFGNTTGNDSEICMNGVFSQLIDSEGR